MDFSLQLVSKSINRNSGINFIFGDVILESPELQTGAGFLLYVKDGVLDMIEGYAYDLPWPNSINDFKLKYEEENKRNFDDIERFMNFNGE
jgi:hypothetical protein